jgi:hypothetical protein
MRQNVVVLMANSSSKNIEIMSCVVEKLND